MNKDRGNVLLNVMMLSGDEEGIDENLISSTVTYVTIIKFHIITDHLNFPTDQYVLQGLTKQFENLISFIDILNRLINGNWGSVTINSLWVLSPSPLCPAGACWWLTASLSTDIWAHIGGCQPPGARSVVSSSSPASATAWPWWWPGVRLTSVTGLG